MTRSRPCAALLVVLLAGTYAQAAEATAGRYQGADELAARIDQLMDATWKKAEVTPARAAEDAEWLRRVYLDLAGRIPSVTEARTFLADRRPDRRQRLVEKLLGGPRFVTHQATVWRGLLFPAANLSIHAPLPLPALQRRQRLVEKLLGGPRFVTHQATVWRALLLPEANVSIQARFQLPAFERWLRDWLQSGRGYDWMARELLTAAAAPGRGALVIGGSSS